MMDAEQPGAPGMLSPSTCLGFGLTSIVFIKGMSLDYTSYSPVTSAWTNDPRSIRDSEGEEVLFLPARPPHLPWNPECGLLICEGLVMLDQDNVPIKDYPGAPRTLATSVGEGPGHLLQGLRSILGMTVKEWVKSWMSSNFMLILLQHKGPNARGRGLRRRKKAFTWDNCPNEPYGSLEMAPQSAHLAPEKTTQYDQYKGQ